MSPIKVNIDKTEEVDDVQRVQIANVLDQKVTKRQATRDEMKGFLWAHGASWERDLDFQHGKLTGENQSDGDPHQDEDQLEEYDLDDLL